MNAHNAAISFAITLLSEVQGSFEEFGDEFASKWLRETADQFQGAARLAKFEGEIEASALFQTLCVLLDHIALHPGGALLIEQILTQIRNSTYTGSSASTDASPFPF